MAPSYRIFIKRIQTIASSLACSVVCQRAASTCSYTKEHIIDVLWSYCENIVSFAHLAHSPQNLTDIAIIQPGLSSEFLFWFLFNDLKGCIYKIRLRYSNCDSPARKLGKIWIRVRVLTCIRIENKPQTDQIMC